MKIRWAGHLALMGEKKVWMEESEGKRPLARPRHG